MRRPGFALVVVALIVAGAATLAIAQDIVPIKISAVVKVTPNKAGTPKHPQGVKIDVRARVETPEDVDPPVAETVDVWFPRAGLYNGRKHPKCNLRQLSHDGPRACPKGSIMGHGTVTARADLERTYPKLTIINGGQREVYFYTVLVSPARVQAAVVATVTKLDGDRRWGYRAHARIPRSLQIVAGIPLRFESIHAVAGRGDWIASTSCPRDRRWRYHVETKYTSGQVAKYDGSVGCRP